MKANEFGVLPQSEIFFISPSPMAQKMLYYPTEMGHFYCVDGYHLVRENYSSLLAVFVLNGQFKFYDDKRNIIVANKGEVALIDCFKPHEYFTDTKFETIWLHFNGSNCMQLYEEIVKNDSQLVKCSDKDRVKNLFLELFDDVSSLKTSESQMSLKIYSLLCEFLSPIHISNKNNLSYEENINFAKQYINDNLNSKLSVAVIAEQIHMSASHFSRIFKQQTGFSPYDYVLVSRLNKAKDLLQKTTMSITNISYEIGFNSESNFIYFFKNNVGISPKKFRNMRF